MGKLGKFDICLNRGNVGHMKSVGLGWTNLGYTGKTPSFAKAFVSTAAPAKPCYQALESIFSFLSGLLNGIFIYNGILVNCCTNWLVFYFPRASESAAWARIDLTGSGEVP